MQGASVAQRMVFGLATTSLCSPAQNPNNIRLQYCCPLAATGRNKDTPNISFRQHARRKARQSNSSSRRPAPRVPGLIPTRTGPPSTEKEQAAMDQLVKGMSDEERVQMAASIEAQNDALLTEYFTSMAPEEQQKLVKSLRINKHYEQLHVWEELLLEPIMKDMLRENLGPELSAIMDKLLGGPDWADADRPRNARLPFSEVRLRLSQLEPEERARVPELFAELEDWQHAYDQMAKIADEDSAAEERASRIGRSRLQRLARQKGLPDPTADEEDADLGASSDVDSDEEQGDGSGAVLEDRRRSNEGSSSSGCGDGNDLRSVPRIVSSRGKKGAPRPSRSAALRAARKAAQIIPGNELDTSRSGSASAAVDSGDVVSAAHAGGDGHDTSSNEDSSSSSSGTGSSTGRLSGEALREAALRAGLSSEMADEVSKLEHTVRRYNPETGPGWAEDGYLGSPDMRCLQSITQTLAYASRLRDRQDLESEGVSVHQLATALEEAFGELQTLMERWKRGFVNDGPTVSCLVFLESQLLQPSSDPENAGSLELPVDPEVIDELARVIRGAQTFEAVISFAQSWEESHPHMPIATALQSYGYSQGGGSSDDSEFVGGYCTLWWAARDRDEEGLTPDTVRQALVSDWDRIDGLAAVDPLMLRCCNELETQNYTAEVLMKWSLHPDVGPRLRSGQPLIQPDDLPSDMQPLFAEAMGWRLEGLDYKIKMLRPSDSRAKPASQRLQAEIAQLESQLGVNLQGLGGGDDERESLGQQAQSSDRRQGDIWRQRQQQQQEEGEKGAAAEGQSSNREWGKGLARTGKRVGFNRAQRLQRQGGESKGFGFGGGGQAKALGRDESQEEADGITAASGAVTGGQVTGGQVTGDQVTGGRIGAGGAEAFTQGGGQQPEQAPPEDAPISLAASDLTPSRDAAKAAALAQAKERLLALKRQKSGRRGRRGG